MLSGLRFTLHGRSDLAVEGILDAGAPALLQPLATFSGAEILCTLIRHLHGETQALGLWTVEGDRICTLRHPEHAPWTAPRQALLRDLRALEASMMRWTPNTLRAGIKAGMRALDKAPAGTHEASILWGQTLRWHKGRLPELGPFDDPLHALPVEQLPEHFFRTLHMDRGMQYSVQRCAVGLILEVMFSHGPVTFPRHLPLTPEETQAWIQDGPAFSLPLAERFLRNPKAFADRQGKPKP